MAILTTLAAQVTPTGISSPDLNDILDTLVAKYQGIYGSDVYLGPDTQDGQWLGVLAQAVYDCNVMAVAVWNNFSPATAVGTGLSSMVKINGLARLVASASQVDVTLTGQAGISIQNGVVGDSLGLGTQWTLPAVVTLPLSGSAVVTATCTSLGATPAAPGTLTQILTPTPGWQSVTNAAAATAGAAVESDAALRLRQAVSTGLPALTSLEAMEGALLLLPGVLRTRPYVNDGGATDSNGVPGHTLAVITEGGDVTQIAATIARYKTPGVSTIGSVSQIVVDQYGVPSTINFTPLVTVPLNVLVLLTPLAGYLALSASLIAQAVAQSVGALPIGAASYLGRLFSPATLSGDAATSGTGQTQSALDGFSSGYNLHVPFGVAQARADRMLTSASASAGSNVIPMVATADYAVGETIFITLTGGSPFRTTITALTDSTLSIAPSIPVSDSVPAEALVYGVADLPLAYDAAWQIAASAVTVIAA